MHGRRQGGASKNDQSTPIAPPEIFFGINYIQAEFYGSPEQHGEEEKKKKLFVISILIVINLYETSDVAFT